MLQHDILMLCAALNFAWLLCSDRLHMPLVQARTCILARAGRLSGGSLACTSLLFIVMLQHDILKLCASFNTARLLCSLRCT
jgi:hypothetical protein